MVKSAPKAVLLLAGRGIRLRPFSAFTPKCMFTVGGMPLLWHSIRNLLDAGVGEFCFVLGFEAEQIKQFMKRYFGSVPVVYIYNDRFERSNSIYSYYLAIPFIRGSNYFRLEGDLLYSKRILTGLMGCGRSPVSAVEKKMKKSPEEYSVTVGRGSRLLSFGKHIPTELAFGEAKGIEFVQAADSESVTNAIAALIRRKLFNEYAEIAYVELIRQGGAMHYWKLSKIDYWCEIDTIEDLRFAQLLYNRTHDHQ